MDVHLQGKALHYLNKREKRGREKRGLEGVVEDGGVEVDVTVGEKVIHGT